MKMIPPIVVLTGAGISAPSGLPTLRGPNGGLWDSEYNERLAQIVEASQRPMEYWRMWGPVRQQFKNAQPNRAHYRLAELQAEYPGTVIVTQNVDGLHQKAGSVVGELHGTLFYNRCRQRRCPQEDWFDDEPRRRPPVCPTCGVFALPATTFFGEYVERPVLDAAMKAIKRCATYMVVGSSGVVPPAATFVHFAREAGARTILVNHDDWSTGEFDEVHLGSCDEVLDRVLLPS